MLNQRPVCLRKNELARCAYIAYKRLNVEGARQPDRCCGAAHPPNAGRPCPRRHRHGGSPQAGLPAEPSCTIHDFLRDFRGDTVHPSTLELIAELGWIDEFLRLPHTKMPYVTVNLGGKDVTFADFSRLKVRCPYIAFMPQWDVLDFLAGKAAAYPSFRLLRRAEATELVTERGRVTGVLADTADGRVEVHRHGRPPGTHRRVVMAHENQAGPARTQARSLIGTGPGAHIARL
ncbi:hypothetical protein Misp01_26370 [Microtetraspora sp. NBRC 13810]|uniref:FAD-dependent monooxygenase n=1 Tax=Microtetraspora sp. NBRC 13810 TaxID=3030990 RepID=UPI0024A53730|nr:FAD-dependent monooxygenase [Microtetraspora sp. NBRC 13810]GLW07507.1 hypothetical protein Misp01_26370 [Microtetraspora sp. NBRC 13810]